MSATLSNVAVFCQQGMFLDQLGMIFCAKCLAAKVKT